MSQYETYPPESDKFIKSDDSIVSGFDETLNARKAAVLVTDENGETSNLLGDTEFGGAPIVVDVDHHEVHCGDSYVVTRTADLGNGAADTIIINVPDEEVKRYHMVFNITSEAEASFEIYEGATTADDGTEITAYNRDRNSSNTTGLSFYHTPTTPSGGTLIQTRHWGVGKSSGGETRGTQELILKNNTKYRLVLTNATTSNNYVAWELDHYIHPGI